MKSKIDKLTKRVDRINGKETDTIVFQVVRVDALTGETFKDTRYVIKDGETTVILRDHKEEGLNEVKT